MTRRSILAGLLGTVVALSLSFEAGAVASPKLTGAYRDFPVLAPRGPKRRNTPPLTDAQKRELNALVAVVKRAVRYRHEAGDDWKIAWSSGDCEDYALRFLHDLLAAGWDREGLSLCWCRTEVPQGHVVLLVGDGEHAYVLDNRWDFALPVQRLRDFGYDFVAVEDHLGGWANMD